MSCLLLLTAWILNNASGRWQASDFQERDVKPMHPSAYSALCNILTAADQVYVRLDAQGMIDRDLINSHASESENFQALKALVNDRRIMEVAVTNEFQYRDRDGSIKTGMIGARYSNELEDAAKHMAQYTKAQLKAMGFRDEVKVSGTSGITLLPGGEYDAKGDGKGSINGNIVIILSSDLTERDAARKVAHEGNGHALFYVLGKDPNHAEDKALGGNQALEDQIQKSVAEAEKNYDLTHPDD